jgi:hypothetical protein
MTKKARKPTRRATTPPDGSDFESLWSDPALGDGIVDRHFHTVPVDKPKDFFRTHLNKDYRRRCEIYRVRNMEDNDLF